MKAVILIGGRGERLMPLTRKTKKAYLPLGNRRVVDFIIDRLPKGMRWSLLENNSGAAAAVAEAVKGETEPILIIAGDNYFSETLDGFVSAYADHTLVGIFDVESKKKARSLGVVELYDDGIQIKRIIEKPRYPITTLVSTGLYIFPPEVFGYIERLAISRPRDNLGEIIKYILRFEPVYSFVVRGTWIDIGTRESYQVALRTVNI